MVAVVSESKGLLGSSGGTGDLLALSLPTVSGLGWESHYYLYDGNGTVMGLLSGDADGGVPVDTEVARYSYDPFGRQLQHEGDQLIDQPWRHASQQWHARSGLVLYYFRAYDPVLGRWLNRDPIEDEARERGDGRSFGSVRRTPTRAPEGSRQAQPGGLNLYTFTHNDPVNRWDLLGLSDGCGMGKPQEQDQWSEEDCDKLISERVDLRSKISELDRRLAPIDRATYMRDERTISQIGVDILSQGTKLIEAASGSADYLSGLDLWTDMGQRGAATQEYFRRFGGVGKYTPVAGASFDALTLANQYLAHGSVNLSKVTDLVMSSLSLRKPLRKVPVVGYAYTGFSMLRDNKIAKDTEFYANHGLPLELRLNQLRVQNHENHNLFQAHCKNHPLYRE